jgi:hypothetical protein
MAFNAYLLLYQYRQTRASTFRSFGGLLMGAIFSMAPLKVRQGYVRKREKEARRAAAAAEGQVSSAKANVEPERVLNASLNPVEGGQP